MKPITNIPIKYSQNFLKPNVWLNAFISKEANISATDTVLDIGAGSGYLTTEIAKKAGKVIAFELDSKQATKIPTKQNIELIVADFLDFDLGILNSYKVFANIPFFLTAAIVRKLFIDSANPPIRAFLFMQVEVAARIMGAPLQQETLFSLLLKPFWDIEIVHYFNKSDFIPSPSVEVVLVEFKRKKEVDVQPKDTIDYYNFISFVLNKRKPTIKLDLINLFTFKQLQIISRQNRFSLQATPKTLSYQQWRDLFNSFKSIVGIEKKELIFGSYSKLMRHKDSQNNKNIIYH